MKIILIILISVYILPSYSQDTTVRYYNKAWQECNKDTAYYYKKIFVQHGLYVLQEFRAKGNIPYSEGTYLDTAFEIKHGTFKWYRENGSLWHTCIYKGGTVQTSEYFYESGKKRGQLIYTSTGAMQQGWDEDGVEIPNYIAEKEATFPGGPFGWRSYLQRKLNPVVAARAKAPIGVYTVKVKFIVDKEGNINNVQAVHVPEACKSCGKEAVRIIKNGPKWEPAIQDNKPVIYQAIQYVSWQVAGG